jgi:hypothetical protein
VTSVKQGRCLLPLALSLSPCGKIKKHTLTDTTLAIVALQQGVKILFKQLIRGRLVGDRLFYPFGNRTSCACAKLMHAARGKASPVEECMNLMNEAPVAEVKSIVVYHVRAQSMTTNSQKTKHRMWESHPCGRRESEALRVGD